MDYTKVPIARDELLFGPCTIIKGVGKEISLIKSSRVASTVNTTLKSTQENLLKLVLQFFSKGTRYDGVRIINKKFAGQTYNLSGDLAKKYSKGVKFTKDGFPDFSPYSKAIVKIDGLKGNTSSDFTTANKALGIKTTPSGYTWHHVEDGRTLMLVPTELHQVVRHTGGAALLKKAYHRDV